MSIFRKKARKPQTDMGQAENASAYSRSNYGNYGNHGGDAYVPQPVQFSDEPLTESRVKPADASAYSRYNPKSEKSKKKKKGKGKKIAIAIVVILLIVLIGAGAAVAYYVVNIGNTLNSTDEKEAQEIQDALVNVQASTEDPFYMALIGTDDRDGVDGARSDTAILARIDPKNAQITLVSIPRDTAIYYNGSVEKFNAAYTYDGPSGTITAMSQLCGVPISHYAEIRFDDLIDFIDIIGGVEVDVPIAIDDEDAGGSLDAGLQTLNGEQAMIFARSRDYVTGDFQRTTSQRLLIQAAVKKILAMPATQLPTVISSLAKCVSTDLKVTDIISLASAFQGGNFTMYSALMPSTTADKDGISYVVCDVTSFKQMMSVVDSGGDPSTVATNTTYTSSSEVANKTS